MSLLFSKNSTFADMGLDLRVFKAIVRGGYQQPTLVQSKTIPLILENRDLLVRSRTGTGKTLAYLLPMLHKVLAVIDAGAGDKTNNVNVYGMVLVPSTDLVHQVLECIKDLKVSSALRFSDTAGISQQPHILVCTPEEVIQLCQDNVISLKLLKVLVMDEADLILSYGYQDDMKVLRTFLPTLVQTILISATLTPEVDGLRLNFLNNPVIVKLEESIGQESLVQHYVNVQEHEKLLYLLAILIYTVQNQRTIVYCNDINTAFSVQLFLTKFNIHSGILNIELPYNSRQATLKKFNQNIINVLICIDETNEEDLLDDESNNLDSKVKIDVVDELAKDDESTATKKKGLTTKKKENNTTRGMDLKDVMFVFNFNFPTTYKSYTHRIGRTARAGKSGMAISFVSPNDQALLANVIENQSIMEGKDVIAANDINITEMPFNSEAVAPFRVRVFDVKKTITHRTIKEARLDAVRQELLHSEKLKTHFEDNPHELHLLKHSGHLARKKYSKELNYIPQYLIPQEYKNQGINGGTIGGTGVEKVKTKKKLSKKRKTDDPLMSLTNKKNKTNN